ncbi:hypothetical protein [Cecembia lonarensis]|nr:hypothetical protein [Cecembia lonarensis]
MDYLDFNQRRIAHIHRLLFLEKKYLDPDFDLASLSAELGVKVEQLEGLIFSIYRKSFVGLIRQLRVEALFNAIPLQQPIADKETFAKQFGFESFEEMEENYYIEMNQAFPKF